MKAWLVALSIPFLMGADGGCDPTVELSIPDIPEHLQHCLPDPLKGKNYKKLNQKQLAIVLVSYKSAHADCEAKINEIRQLYQFWQANK